MLIRKEQYLEVNDPSSWSKFRAELDRQGQLVSYDTETTGLSTWKGARPFLQQVWLENLGFFIDKRRVHPDLWRDFAAAVHQRSKCWLGQNLKFELLMCRAEFNLRYTGPLHDTIIQSHLLNENISHRLKDTGERLFGEAASSLEKQVIEWLDTHNGGKKEYDKLPFELVSYYGMQDVYLTRKVHDHQYPQVRSEFEGLYQTECELVKVLADMESEGLPVDKPYLESLIPKFEAEMAELRKRVIQHVGYEFDLASPVQLQTALYTRMGFRPKIFTEKGQPSTDKNALLGLDHPVGKLLLEYSQLETSLHTFVLPWLGFIAPDGRLHPSFNQTGTVSGRFSSSEPNAQQIPKRSPQAKALRKAFLVPEGRVGMSHDQKQMEMVGVAFYSGDPDMQKAIREGTDLHAMTAVELGLTKDKVCTPDQRRLGKGGNFAIVYCCGKNKISTFLSQDQYAGRYVSPEEGADLLERYSRRFPLVKTFQQRVIQTIRQRPDHAVKNLLGRKLRLSYDRAYVGVNRLVQSWAADVMKLGMVKTWRYAQQNDLRLYANIHDDLKTHCEVKHLREHAQAVDGFLTQCPGLTLPIKTEINTTQTNWAEEKEYQL